MAAVPGPIGDQSLECWPMAEQSCRHIRVNVTTYSGEEVGMNLDVVGYEGKAIVCMTPYYILIWSRREDTHYTAINNGMTQF